MDGGYATPSQKTDTVANGISLHVTTLSLDGREENQNSVKAEKDPRRIARKYQMDLCKKALEENIVAYIGTGCGKTHIAVLLMYEMGHLIKKPKKEICIFLAPTVALVQQQAKVIQESVDFKVGIYCGSSTHLKSRHDWEKEIEENEVFVMTPQILLHYLSHRFIKIELIALLIFDECHYAQLESNHPYAEIMKIFYKGDLAKLPRIFGMTASPKLGRGGSVDSLEALLRAKVYSVEDPAELEQFVTSPEVNVYYYNSRTNGYYLSLLSYTEKFEDIKHQCLSKLRMNLADQCTIQSTKKSLLKLHSSIIFCLDNLGLLGALKAIYTLKGGSNEIIEPVVAKENGDDNLCSKYLHRVISFLSCHCKGADLSCLEVLKEPFFSRKLLCLIQILCNFRSQPNMKCIIFVKRIIIARSLSDILQNLNFLSSWKCGFLLGVHSGHVSRKNTKLILEKFNSGEVNLLVATKVAEEGLDIQTCCLVIRFDLPETVSSFIQSRGRARMLQSEYALLVDRGNPKEIQLIENFKKDEAQMNEEISSRKSHVQFTDFEEITYKVDVTGATISSVSSIGLLHRYCSKLPRDEYFNPKPQFFYDHADGTVCRIILPANAPIHQIVSVPQPSADAAKRDACLKACKALHEIGALTDYLLPEEDDDSEEIDEDLSDSDGCDADETRAELHEMFVPAALREQWTESGNSVNFNSYYIKLCPDPADRAYRSFGLFVKTPLPEEAGKMRLDLCLDHGRMVITQLVPSGLSIFDKEQIASAEKFQRMSFKIILDRHKFVPEYVPLEDDANETSSSTFYLLLPVIQHRIDEISVDWALVNRCLSSPVFSPTGADMCHEISQAICHLNLANGRRSVQDIMNSLVYVPCKGTFFFICDIFWRKTAHSSFDDVKSHAEHYAEVFDIHLKYPDQPLLKAKQLFVLNNLLRKKKHAGSWREKKEHFIELPPEICQLKIIGFSKDIGSSLSLLPSIMHRLESFLVAIELKEKFIASFSEGAEVSTHRILEALTTERCCEQFSLERLEVLGDAFLKFAVGRHLVLKHDLLDEGQLTRKRSSIVNNSNLLKLATRNNLQVYIRDQSFEADQFFAFGRPCPVSCNKENEKKIHHQQMSSDVIISCEKKHDSNSEVRCNRCHHWLHKKTIADVVEALIGAFIVDSGFKAATAFLKWIGVHADFTPSQIDNICSASKEFLPLADLTDVNALENLLGYKFSHKGLLIQAFVHPSFNNHLGGCYQRLEFLGDAVLDYLITSYLFSVYPKLKPGQLTDLRSVAVNNISFANAAGRWSFHKFIICDSVVLRESMSRYIERNGPSASAAEDMEEIICPKALGDLVESCMGALYLDTGFDLNRVWKIMLSFLNPIISPSKLQFNPLRELQELCQSYNWELQFSSMKKDGKYFIEAKVDEEKVCATASASNISGKAAKKMAARQIFECLKAQGFKAKSKSLEEVLKKSEKKKAKLIGYNEMPSLETTKSRQSPVQKTSQDDCNTKVYPVDGMSTSNCNTIAGAVKRTLPHKASECYAKRAIDGKDSSSPPSTDPQGTGASCSISAKSRLYEICTANCWKPPIFECCQEEGPSHLKEFLFKVVLEIDEMPNETFEFYGESRTRKKDAAEHAAEGALWFLKHEGYIWDKKCDR